MGILTDALIDAKAQLCWNHQQEQLLGKVKIDCICGKLADMIYLTRQEIAEEIEAYRVDRCRCEQTLDKDCDALINAVSIARGTK